MPSFLAVGLGKACQVAAEEMTADKAYIERLARRLHHGVTSQLQVSMRLARIFYWNVSA